MRHPSDEVHPTGTGISAPGAELRYLEAFLPAAEAGSLQARLRDTVDWRQHHVRIAGRVVPSPRLSAWYGDPGIGYSYSGLRLVAEGWFPVLEALRERVESAVGQRFNSALLNRYRDGSDSMGWHSDDEPELGPRPLIASVSLGEVRRFILKHRRRKDLAPVRFDLEPGSLLVMAGETQHEWRHALPRSRSAHGERINVTFRRILPPEA